MMKLTDVIIPMMLLSAAWSCGSDSFVHEEYSSETCERLAFKIDSRDSLTQSDYTSMIAQSEEIMKYLIEESKKIDDMPDSTRCGAWRVLLAEPEYMERFSYMFTLGSALFSAERNNLLDERNRKLYDALDRYNEELASISERD